MNKIKLIQLLKEANGFVSGEEMSREFDVSRSAIWKSIKEIKDLGYEIEAVSHRGYRFVSAPDILFPFEIQDNLSTKRFGQNIFHFDSIGTTMAEAFECGEQGAVEGTVICAEEQTSGRGRFGREWKSPSGGVYFSILLRPDISIQNVSQVTLVTAVALCESIRTFADVDVKIKWPNDLLIRDKKVAGILTELHADMDRVHFVVVGIGVNVNTKAEDLIHSATSITNETYQDFSRVEFLKMFLEIYERWYDTWLTKGFSFVLDFWRQYSATLGRDVCVTEGKQKICGEAVDVDEFGRLILKTDNGELQTKMSGEVTLR